MSDFTPSSLLLDWLNTHCPQYIVAIGQSRPPALDGFMNDNDIQTLYLNNHHDLQLDEHIPDTVIISDYLEYCSRESGQELLARLRNHLTAHVLIFIDHQKASDWDFNTLIGLGFKKLMTFDHSSRSLTCYSYDIDNYNPKRSWNNADHWANPEMFGKYWW
ncbi:DUF6231 family protein [Hahella ganghwensis]|uniref:DUF6231 family protein n=1 Tax=Hahella ganghwensis TaxID=286420 RepID=UPI000372EC9E|nr:DUF6231 family protein [Hahella ganghwensis]